MTRTFEEFVEAVGEVNTTVLASSRSKYSVLDLCGQLVEPGDYIVYAGALGRCAVLRLGRVVSIKTREKRWSEKRDQPTVQAVTVEHIPDRWNGKDFQIQKNGGLITLSFMSRLVKVAPRSVPKEAKKLLDDAFDRRKK